MGRWCSIRRSGSVAIGQSGCDVQNFSLSQDAGQLSVEWEVLNGTGHFAEIILQEKVLGLWTTRETFPLVALDDQYCEFNVYAPSTFRVIMNADWDLTYYSNELTF